MHMKNKRKCEAIRPLGNAIGALDCARQIILEIIIIIIIIIIIT